MSDRILYSRREGNLTRNLDNMVNNLFYYSGSENTLSLSRNYYEPFICLFNIALYPFDTQTCDIVFTVPESVSKLVELEMDNMTAMECGNHDKAIQSHSKEISLIDSQLSAPHQLMVTIRSSFTDCWWRKVGQTVLLQHYEAELLKRRLGVELVEIY